METRLKQLPVKELILYAATLACEFPAVCVRFFVITILAAIISLFSHGMGNLIAVWVFAAYWPLIWSVIALIPKIGHVGEAWAWRTRDGGRKPTDAEQAAYQAAVEELQQRATKPLPLPKDWFVMDERGEQAAVCGHTLMLTRAMLESPYLPAVLAHELGHLNSWDARFTAALNRLVIQRWPGLRSYGEEGPSTMPIAIGAGVIFGPVLVLVAWLTRKAYTSCRGGLGLWLTKPLWGHLWRQGEFDADNYAASLGQAQQLAEFLQWHALDSDRPMPFTWLADYTHPSTAVRIDKLTAYTPAIAEAAPTIAESAPIPPVQQEIPGLETQTA